MKAQKEMSKQEKRRGKKGLIFLALLGFFIFVAVNGGDRSANTDSSENTKLTRAEKKAQEEADKKAEEDAQKQAEEQARQKMVNRFASQYCSNRQAVKVSVTDEAKAKGWPINDGSGWTNEECSTIISKLIENGATEKELEVVVAGNYAIGMKEMSLLYSLGSPGKINKTHFSGYTKSQYVYGDPIYNALYIYTENGVVTSVQN